MLTEQVFTIPGFGKLIVDAVFNRDYAVVQGVVLVTATAYIAAEPAGRHGLFRGQPAAAALRRQRPSCPFLPPRAAPARTPAGPWRRAWRRLQRRRGALLGLAVVLVFVVLALFAPWIAPHDPIATSWSAIRKAPSAQHWFGTDEIGRDVLSRVIWGTRASLLAGVVSVSHLAADRRADRAGGRASSAAGSTA